MVTKKRKWAENIQLPVVNGSIKGNFEEDRVKSMVLAVVHLLVFGSKHASFQTGFQKSVMTSIKSIRGFLSSSTMSTAESLVFQGSLAAMPGLLCHNENLTVARSIALLGDMALHSYQSMMQIACETRVLYSLLSHLNSASAEIQKEACHTVASIASGTQGRRALCGLGAIQKLMHLLFVVTGFFMNSVDQRVVTKSLDLTSRLYLSSHTEVLLLSGVLEGLDMLTCNNYFESLGEIPQGSRVFILQALQSIWKRFRNNFSPFLRGDHTCVIAKMIVWLAMEQENANEGINDGCKDTIEILFGGMDREFEHFWDEHWEHSPFLIFETIIGGHARGNLLKAWHSDGDSFFLRKLLTTTSTCHPFSCDELETSQIYREIANDLGKPLVFGQDIRLVKSVCTAGCREACSNLSVLEEDYHEMEGSERRDFIYADVNTCENAFELGYTIALRGLEFRCSHIAAIAEALAVLFGQATVGANLYMTPLNAQGFKPHYDDHCVLVWQLTGWKAWKLWAPETFLPRLYSQDPTFEIGSKDEEDACKLSLGEGCILYIPRGFPHAATTRVNAQESIKCCKFHECEPKGNTCFAECFLQSDDLVPMVGSNKEGCSTRKKHERGSFATYFSASCSCFKNLQESQHASDKNMTQSVHITFGVEVEPPFDWEGLVHMSLQCWTTKQNQDMLDDGDSGARACSTPGRKLSDLYQGLLHVAIRQCGDRCSAFRKACLIAAKFQCEEEYSTDRFESYFKELIKKFATLVTFKEALHMVLTAIDTPAHTSLDWMHWLRHLSREPQSMVWSDPVTFFHNRLIDSKARIESLEDMEAKFTIAKDSFVSCANYAQASDVFIGLLHKYRSVRRKYAKGMLALHV